MIRQLLKKTNKSAKQLLKHTDSIAGQKSVVKRFRSFDPSDVKSARKVVNQTKASSFNGYSKSLVNNEHFTMNGVQEMEARLRKQGGFKEASWGFKINDEHTSKVMAEAEAAVESTKSGFAKIDDFPGGKVASAVTPEETEAIYNDLLGKFEENSRKGAGFEVFNETNASFNNSPASVGNFDLLKTSDIVRESFSNSENVLDKSKEIVKQVGRTIKKGLVADFDLPGMTKNQRRAVKWTSRGVTGSTLFIGSTALLDFAMDRRDAAEAKKMNQEQLKRQEQGELDKRESIKRKARARSNFNATPEMGSLVFDMFQQRTGHHKMGNNKFQ